MAYIICEKRKGNPKVNVEVCRRKCKFMEQCKPYTEYLKAPRLEEPSLDVGSHTAAVSHHEGAVEEVQAA